MRSRQIAAVNQRRFAQSRCMNESRGYCSLCGSIEKEVVGGVGTCHDASSLEVLLEIGFAIQAHRLN
jgi:hypothetical protein